MSRYLTAALLTTFALLPACKDPDADARITKLEAQVQALQKQIGQQPDTMGMVTSLQSQIDDLKKQSAGHVKIPHLVNKDTGEDLGPFISWDERWIDSVGAVIPNVQAWFVFDNPDCTGTKALNRGGNNYEYDYVVGPDLQLYIPGQQIDNYQVASFMLGDACVQGTGGSGGTGYEINATGIHVDRVPARSGLRVMMQ